MSLSAVDTSTDGRVLRRERNRAEIVDALLALLREGHIEVSAAAIAERAKLSERSIFRYFDDLDDLYRTVCAVQFERERKHATIDSFSKGSTEDKIAHFVEQRVRLFTSIGSIGRASRVFAHRNAVIAKELRRARVLLRRQIADHFADEIAALPSAERSHAATIIDSLCNFESFSIMRSDYDMTIASITTTLTTGIRKVLS
jgi:AcrR family transcriptional regulator